MPSWWNGRHNEFKPRYFGVRVRVTQRAPLKVKLNDIKRYFEKTFCIRIRKASK